MFLAAVAQPRIENFSGKIVIFPFTYKKPKPAKHGSKNRPALQVYWRQRQYYLSQKMSLKACLIAKEKNGLIVAWCLPSIFNKIMLNHILILEVASKDGFDICYAFGHQTVQI